MLIAGALAACHAGDGGDGGGGGEAGSDATASVDGSTPTDSSSSTDAMKDASTSDAIADAGDGEATGDVTSSVDAMTGGPYALVHSGKLNGGSQAAGSVTGGSFKASFNGNTNTALGAGFRLFGQDVTSANDAGVCNGLCTSGGARVVFARPNAERAIVAYVVGTGAFGEGRRGVAIFQEQ